MDRRTLIRTGAWLALTLPQRTSLFAATPRFTSDPFRAGIVSGDPLQDGIVLWTRLMPDPQREAAWQKENVAVEWVIAEDEKLSRVVKRGREWARPELGHSVHADVRGLRPARWYWYQFRVAGTASPVGRTRTAGGDTLKFAFASCQHFETGYYTAYEHMAKQDLDLVVHLGDYIYEGAAYKGTQFRPRKHTGGEIKTLNDYRERYALYRSDANLREAHRVFPWIVTWDDHEVDNNYAGDIPEDNQTREAFLERRANAYQAYYEFMPLRRESMPQGSHMQLYRALNYGKLAKFWVVDTRQYRSDQPCGDGNKPGCEATRAADQTMFGVAQEKWLTEGMKASKSQWNILANQVLMAKCDRQPGEGALYSMDQWGGYDTARERFMKYLGEAKPSNPVVITGDIHSSWQFDLTLDYQDPQAPIVATEFVGTSITSGGDGDDGIVREQALRPENPHMHLYSNRRGYVKCSVKETGWDSEYIAVEKVSEPEAAVSVRASFHVEPGVCGARPA